MSLISLVEVHSLPPLLFCPISSLFISGFIPPLCFHGSFSIFSPLLPRLAPFSPHLVPAPVSHRLFCTAEVRRVAPRDTLGGVAPFDLRPFEASASRCGCLARGSVRFPTSRAWWPFSCLPSLIACATASFAFFVSSLFLYRFHFRPARGVFMRIHPSRVLGLGRPLAEVALASMDAAAPLPLACPQYAYPLSTFGRRLFVSSG